MTVAEFDGRNGGNALQELLAEQMASMQRLLQSNGERMSGVIEQTKTEKRELEAELLSLRVENERFRAKLINAGLIAGERSETGGTGELSCMNPNTRSGWMSSPTAATANPQDQTAGSAATATSSATPVIAMQSPAAPSIAVPGGSAPEMSLPGAVTNDTPVRANVIGQQSQRNGGNSAAGDLLTTELTPVLPCTDIGDNTSTVPCDGGGDTTPKKDGKLSTPRKGSERRGTVQLTTSSAPKPVFADVAAMKEKLKENIGRKAYNVHDYYWETGFWQKVATNPIFEHITLAVIGFNALWIWIDTDNNGAATLPDAHPVFIVAENLFCLFFSFEWFSRFMAFKHKKNGLKDAWFVFDSCLVSTMVLETWVVTFIILCIGGGSGAGLGDASILRLFRLLRLTRLARMVRLLRAMPELMVMIKAMGVAMRSVFFALCLLMSIIYVFAIAFTQLLEGTAVGDSWFSSVPISMNTLLLRGTMPDQEEVVEDVATQHWFFRFFMLFYILLASLTVMNMLVGILCEVVSVVSTVEKEELLINYVKGALQEMIMKAGLDVNGDNRISRGEFEQLLDNREAARALQDVGVDVVGLVDYIDFIFVGGRDMSFGDFMDMVLQLRGSNTATVKDIVDMRKMMANQFDKIDAMLTKQ